MTSSAVRDIVCAHSPDSDDAFMFYGLATKKIRSRFVNIKHVLEDIESLNRKAMEGVYELTAISYHAYPYVADKYVLMASGSSVGDGYGPMVIAMRPMQQEELKGKRIAIPDKITDAVKDHSVDAGLVIHEAQLTFGKGGFHNVLDLGRWWKKTFNLPLPLGANALLRSLDPQIQTECCRLMRDSIQYALDNTEEALNYAMQFARDMEQPLAEKFVGMYVNHHTVDAGEEIPLAAQKLLDLGHEAGIIPHRIEVEFIR